MYQDRANLIKGIRKELGWTQTMLANEVGCGLRTIQRIEDAESASDKFLKKIAEKLGLDDNQVLIDVNKSNKKKIKTYRIHKVLRGKELYHLLYVGKQDIIRDYSIAIEGRNKMDLVLETFELTDRITSTLNNNKIGKRWDEEGVDFLFAPLLAELKKQKLGLFAKRFCSLTRGQMNLEQFEKQLYGDVLLFDCDGVDRVKNVLLLFINQTESQNHLILNDSFKTKIEYFDIQEDYIYDKLRLSSNFWAGQEIIADDDDSLNKSVFNAKTIIQNSAAFGYLNYLKTKEEENPEYYKKFKNNYYFDLAHELVRDMGQGVVWDFDFDNNNDVLIKELPQDKEKIDKKSYDSGQKDAALLWHAWELFNINTKYTKNKYIEMLQRNRVFPDIQNPSWKGPEKTELIVYDYKGQFGGIDHEDLSWPAGAIYESHDGDIINGEDFEWAKELEKYTWKGQVVENNTKNIIEYIDKKTKTDSTNDSPF